MTLPIIDTSTLTQPTPQPNSFIQVPENNPTPGPPQPQGGPPRVLTPVRTSTQYVEVQGSPRGHFRLNGSEVTRDLYVDWTDPLCNAQAIKQLLGYPLVVPGPTGGRFVSRFLGDFVPVLSASDGFEPVHYYLWATQIISTHGHTPHPVANKDANNWHTYATGIISLVYETLPYRLLQDSEMIAAGLVDNNGSPDDSYLARFVIIQPQPSARLQTLPQNSMIFASDGSVVKATVGVYEISADLSITWVNLPEAAVGTRLVNPYIADMVDSQPYTPPIENCLGKINSKIMYRGLTPRKLADKGTLMLTAVILKPYDTPIGTRLWDCEYRFRWFPGVSTPLYSVPGLANQPVRGHVLILRPDVPLPIPLAPVVGYDETVVRTAPASSNALLSPPADGINQVNWADLTTLFQVPALAIDNP